MEGDAVEGPVYGVGREEVVQVLDEMKTGKRTLTFKCTTRVD